MENDLKKLKDKKILELDKKEKIIIDLKINLE